METPPALWVTSSYVQPLETVGKKKTYCKPAEGALSPNAQVVNDGVKQY